MKDLFLSRSKRKYESRREFLSNVAECLSLKTPLYFVAFLTHSKSWPEKAVMPEGSVRQGRTEKTKLFWHICASTHSYTDNKNNSQSKYFKKDAFHLCHSGAVLTHYASPTMSHLRAWTNTILSQTHQSLIFNPWTDSQELTVLWWAPCH